MWRVTVSIVSIMLLVQVKAAPDISLEDLLERLETLEHWKRETEHEVAALRETVAQQGAIIKNLERSLAIQADKTASLHSCKQKEHQDTHEDQAEIGENSRNDRPASRNRIIFADDEIPVEVSTLSKRAIAGGVAFTAYLDHDLDIGNKQTIKFNKIITNDGNAYNVHTGVFTCPEAGVYLFTYFIGERSETSGHQMFAELRVNSQHVVGAVVETTQAAQDLQGGNTAVVRLNLGDSVWVDSYLSSVSHIEGSGYRTSTFTGIYMYG